jgi:Cu-Zn family superoxide dismutase
MVAALYHGSTGLLNRIPRRFFLFQERPMRMRLAGIAFCVLAVPMLAAPAPKKLKVKLISTSGQSDGYATFQQKGDVLEIRVEAVNLPEGEHGIHIHQHPVCDAPDFKTAGGHFNPAATQHGFLNPMGHHAGDTPENLQSTGAGNPSGGSTELRAEHVYQLKDASMGTGKADDILANGGTSLIIHAGPDDMKTDPSGNSGARIACGVISLTAPTPQAAPTQ